MYDYYVSVNGISPHLQEELSNHDNHGSMHCLTSVQEAFQLAALEHPTGRVVIALEPGEYAEKLVLVRPETTLIGLGEKPEDTVITFGDGAYEMLADGTHRGTFRTATLRVSAPDFIGRNLTIRNTCGPGKDAGQGLALYADGDHMWMDHCRLEGCQDTLFTAPLPEKEFSVGGFRGPGEFLPRSPRKQLYTDCYIEGEVDFIFGSAAAWFERCEFFSKNCGRDDVQGFVFAGSAPEGQAYNYVAHDCRFTSDCPEHSVYLGRPWREYAQTVLISCEIGSHIKPEGWDDWASQGGHDHLFYAEYGCFGPGSDRTGRPDWTRELTPEEASEFTCENVLGFNQETI